ncbi:N-acetylglucosamine-6-phosphate deacetylase [Streptomyces sp. UH6]|uniref:N-acetylglucosamine-6-phosphate deacetylase n=1 Tax=Streptomyces sp. UH6 TaxID=2748379 RepID=UPI0015D48C01|nr:N-acetylglucosamine-6-phosphate deacetylase [Streptomyces sp. UH6]NYV75607.1 N-acetylglucosamine-6-phosphate deacetylase [Streptomyces sp. UH6]
MNARPVLVHTHGIGGIDYSSMTPDQLGIANGLAEKGGFDVVPGIFLGREHLSAVTDLMYAWHENRASLPAVLGFSVEGPLLGRTGGVPPRGIWSPTAQEWERIAVMGRYGLRYIVMGPDMGELDDELDDGLTYRDVIDLCYVNGVKIALGHFQHHAPELSAERTRAVIAHVQDRYGPGPDVLLTDHLYNDMPRNFRHVWRTAEERSRRAEQIAPVLAADWETADLDRLLGPVPATLLRAAREGHLLPFLNFDGDHVDLEICRRTLDHLGPERLIGITDDIAVPFLAGEELHHREGSGLWYRSDGIVAAGSGELATQRRNLRSLTADGSVFDRVFGHNARRGLTPVRVPAVAGVGGAGYGGQDRD